MDSYLLIHMQVYMGGTFRRIQSSVMKATWLITSDSIQWHMAGVKKVIKWRKTICQLKALGLQTIHKVYKSKCMKVANYFVSYSYRL